MALAAMAFVIGCSPSPTRRPQTAEEFADALIPMGPAGGAGAVLFEEDEDEASSSFAAAVDPPVCVGELPAPRPRLPRSEITCCYAPTLFQRVVREQHSAFAACYDDVRARNSLAAGRVVARFIVGWDGQPPRACVEQSAIADPAFLRCIAQGFHDTRWPVAFPDDPCTEPATVVYPLVFEPPEVSAGSLRKTGS